MLFESASYSQTTSSQTTACAGEAATATTTTACTGTAAKAD